MKPNKFLKDVIGIYGIRNLINDKLYIGKTHCMYVRCHQYVYDFQNRKLGHLNDYLFNAITKNGLQNFEFFPLEFCNPENLSIRELHWITYFKTTNRNFGYNLRLDSSGGMIPAEETRTKISATLRRQWAEGLRSEHSQKLKKNWADNPERKFKQGVIFSKIRTKFEYQVHHLNGEIERCLFKRLEELGLENVISTFHRKKTNDVTIKGLRVIRFPRGENG